MFIILGVLFGLLTMVAYGLANGLSQPLARKLKSSQFLFLRGLIICLFLLIASLPSYESFNQLRPVTETILLGMLGYLPLLAFTHAIKISRLGVVAPIAGTAPIVTVLMAFALLHAPIEQLQWLAIIMIIIANVVVTVNLKDWRSSSKVKVTSGIPYALLASIGWGIFFFLLIYQALSLGPWLAAFLVELGVTIAAGLHCLIAKEKVRFKEALTRPVIINALLVVIGISAYTFGVSNYHVGIVAAIGNSTTVVSVLVGIILYKERMRLKEKLAAATMVLGVFLVSIRQ